MRGCFHRSAHRPTSRQTIAPSRRETARTLVQAHAQTTPHHDQSSRRQLLLSLLPTTLALVHSSAQAATATDDSSRQDRDGGAHASTSGTDLIQRDYDRYAADYDDLDGGDVAGALGFDDLREQLLRKAQGQVLEIAVGTGLNLKHYSFQQGGGVDALTGIDISSGMLRRAAQRVASDPGLQGAQVSLKQADATALPLPTSSFDCVVDTFSLCVIPDPLSALKEMARVVKPGGKVLLLEHARSDNPILGAYQDVSAAAVAATAKGCVWNQDVPALLAAAGLRLLVLERYTAGTIVFVEATLS